MLNKFHLMLIIAALTAFNVWLVRGMLELLEDGQSGVEILLFFGAIIGFGTIPMNVICILAIILPWEENPTEKYKAPDFTKSSGWRLLKEIIDILD